jgi:iron(III) transport system permease protein
VTLATGPDARVSAGPVARPAGAETVPARRHRPWWLLGAATLVALVLATPLIFLLVDAAGAGAGNVVSLIDRSLTAQLLWNTVRLAFVVTLLCVILGTGSAWLVERTDLPLRHVWAVLLVVPLAIPDFVVSWGWASLSTWVAGFKGAVLVMTLSLYPLVYLPVASSLRNADPAQEEVARSLGVGRLRTFVRITLGQATVAIAGGAILVTLVLLAEYGAFELLGYRTFTTEIFTEINGGFSLSSASALSIVLLFLGVVVLGAEAAVRRKGRTSRSDRMAQRVTTRHRLGLWTVPAGLALTALVGLALGVPVGSAAHWWAQGTRVGIPGVGSMASATWHTAIYSVCAAALATLMAAPVAVLAVRHHGAWRRLLERSTYLVLAMPGIIIALAFTYFSEHYLGGFEYQHAPMLVLTYAILFFPLALVGVRASVAQAPVGLEDVARSLGRSPLAVWWKVTRPLVTPGLAAAFCLVFLSCVTELTATLLLHPTGVQTLATEFWTYQSDLEYGQAAPYALLMIAIAAIPSYVLGRFFDRLPARAGSQP